MDVECIRKKRRTYMHVQMKLTKSPGSLRKVFLNTAGARGSSAVPRHPLKSKDKFTIVWNTALVSSRRARAGYSRSRASSTISGKDIQQKGVSMCKANGQQGEENVHFFCLRNTSREGKEFIR